VKLATCLLSLAAICSLPSASAQTAAGAAAELDGLWSATRFFGPEVRGDLWIERRDGAYHASIAGRAVAANVSGESVRVVLPHDEGEFRGRFDQGHARIVGHWIQPRGAMGAMYFATPTTLARQREAAWRGEVRPLEERMTVHLMLTTGADGVTHAFLRNPERNIGVFYRLTRLTRTGDDVELWGRRGKDGPDQVVAGGHYDAENKLLSVNLPGRGTYDLEPAGAVAEASFYPRGRNPARYEYHAPPFRDDGWPVGTLDEAGIDRGRISAFIQKLIDMPIDSVSASDIHGVLIARHGKLVLEEYFHDFGRDREHDTRSAAKSLTALLVGATLLDGASFDTSTRVYAYLGIPNPDDARKRAVTVAHLLTMTSGFYCDDGDDEAPGNEDRMQEQTDEPDWWRYTLDVPMAGDPGSKAVYCSCNPNLLGAVMSRATGAWLPELFRDRLAIPLGFRNYHVNLMPTRDAYLGGGIYLEPRDFMKIAQLVLDGGTWQGRRIVSSEWIGLMTSPHAQIGGRDYGYLWWLADYPYHGRTVRAVFAGGNGGQIAMAIPELDLVIAFNGGNYSDRALFIPQRVLVPEDILPAVDE
jgi:CubicO group peptidase (beta-lactamase class C family)